MTKMLWKSSTSAQEEDSPCLSLIASFERATGVKVPHKIGERRAGDIEKIWADPKKANEDLG